MPSLIVFVTSAAAVSVGVVPYQGESCRPLQVRWSYVQAWSKPSSSARRHNRAASFHRYSGRIVIPNRMPAP